MPHNKFISLLKMCNINRYYNRAIEILILYNIYVTKDFYFQMNAVLLNFLFINKNVWWFPQNIKKQLFSALTIIRNMYWAANHHIIMSSEEDDDAENSALHHRNKLLLKIYSNRKHLFK